MSRPRSHLSLILVLSSSRQGERPFVREQVKATRLGVVILDVEARRLWGVVIGR